MVNRLAVLGDIHSNGAALDAVVKAIAAKKITTGVCTGDIVMRGRDPEHCVTTIRRLGWPCVLGNTDRKVAFADDPPKKRSKLKKLGTRWWTRPRLSKKNVSYLKSLPLVQQVSLGGYTIAVLHGMPDDPTEAMTVDTSAVALMSLARALDADCVISGHTHRPFVRRVGQHLFVNPGSVGESRTTDQRPSWAWIEATAEGLDVHLERVENPLAMIRGKGGGAIEYVDPRERTAAAPG